MIPDVTDLWDRATRALQTAREWAKTDPDAAASRAYYAAFYAVTALFILDGRTFTKHSSVEAAVHRDLIKPGKWPRELGTAFSWLFSLRQTGDYGGDLHVTLQEADTAVKTAGDILKVVSQSLFPSRSGDDARGKELS
ncbi:MAG: HEPN domain-containing protein [Planctomycetota bacterium]